MTEKDAVRIATLDIPSEEKFRFLVAPISVSFVSIDKSPIEKYFIDSILKRIESKNGKYYVSTKQFNI